MVVDRSDHIWPVKSVAAAAVIVLEVVIELEGLAILQCQHAVESPPILQALPATAHLGKLIGKVPSKALRDVEVGWSILELRIIAVVGLGGIGLEVFAVAGIVQGLRPDISSRST